MLPCGWTVCDRHLRNNDLVICKGCKANHSQHHKDHKFPVNKTVALQIKLNETSENLNRAFEKFSVLKSAHDDPQGILEFEPKMFFLIMIIAMSLYRLHQSVL